MANLVIDIGNTFTKFAIFEGNKILFADQFEDAGNDFFENLLNKYTIKRAIISTVKSENGLWQTSLANNIEVVYFNRGMTNGINNHYKTPETLGLDRLAALIGAKYLYPEKNALIIDGGTCITYDWIDFEGNYYGGSISPGLNMRYKALNHYTSGLPLVGSSNDFNENFGNNTLSAIQSGVQNGIKYELEGFINNYKNNNQDFNIILSGGDSIFFDTLLKNSIFAPCIKIEPQLVLIGLNAAILNNND